MSIESIKSKLKISNKVLAGIGIGAGVFLAVTGIYYFIFYGKLKAKEVQKAAAFNTLKAQYDSYEVLLRNYPNLVKERNEAAKKFIGLLPELPPRKDIPQLLMKISSIEKTLNLSLKMFKPEKTEMKNFYETVPFAMDISGDFKQVYKFFYKLSKMRRIVDVSGVSMARGSKGSLVTVGFTGTAYSFTGTSPVLKGKTPAGTPKANPAKGKK